MKVAFATNDGNKLIKDHFGEAKYFDIYEITEEKIKFIERRINKSGEEKEHGDPEKAKKIREILKDVDILVGFAMGPNINRMKEYFLPIVTRYEDIKENLQIFRENFDRFKEILKEKGRIVIINRGPKIVIV